VEFKPHTLLPNINALKTAVWGEFTDDESWETKVPKGKQLKIAGM